MNFLHVAFAICASVYLSSGQDCSQYTKNDCLFKHISGCSDSSACTKGSSSGSGAQSDPGSPAADTGSSSACFHGDEYVLTEQYGRMKMSELVGKPLIKVQSRDDQGRMVFSPIYYWLHSEADTETNFITLETEHGRTLSLTEEHLIYRTDCRGRRTDAVFASRIQPGHCLMVIDDDAGRFVESRVERRTLSRKRGLYAPITEQGNVVVNGVLASCFTSLENEALQKIMYRYMDAAYRFMKSMASSSSVAGVFYSTPFAETVHVPEVVFSFWDLSKKFVDH